LERRLYRFIEECLRSAGKSPVLSDRLGDRWYSLTGEEILEEARVRSRTFSSSGVEEGMKVALVMREGVEWFLNLLSLLRLGATVVPLSTSMPQGDILAVLDDSEAGFVFVDEGSLPLCGLLSEKEYIAKLVCSKRGLFEEKSASTGGPHPDPELEDVPLLVYTSGTTGGVKGVMLTDDNLIYCVERTWERGGFFGVDRTLNVLPLCHTYGLTCGLLSMIYGGVHVYISSGIKRLREELGYVRPPLFMGVPLIYRKIMEAFQRKVGRGRGAKSCIRQLASPT